MTLIEREHSVAVITFQVSFKRETLFGEFIHIPAELNSKMKIERDAGGPSPVGRSAAAAAPRT